MLTLPRTLSVGILMATRLSYAVRAQTANQIFGLQHPKGYEMPRKEMSQSPRDLATAPCGAMNKQGLSTRQAAESQTAKRAHEDRGLLFLSSEHLRILGIL
ncbi:hypothetical protein CBOM_07601 [Ceraceosorus bombacis]|uniref:Uncharacterized protein n=1 Tax=Ceraceosorus bombacis TaxID=401625 RepID=A0A0N7L8Y8_9BASI|nr:hypothetical protein CBOM_07601 [Ceraceosorus bombacis]